MPFEVTILFSPKRYFDDSWYTEKGIRKWFKEDGEVIIIRSIRRVEAEPEKHSKEKAL